MALLKEGIDFYFNEQGLMVLTASYLKRRGYCCDNDCLNCPYQGRIEERASCVTDKERNSKIKSEKEGTS